MTRSKLWTKCDSGKASIGQLLLGWNKEGFMLALFVGVNEEGAQVWAKPSDNGDRILKEEHNPVFWMELPMTPHEEYKLQNSTI